MTDRHQDLTQLLIRLRTGTHAERVLATEALARAGPGAIDGLVELLDRSPDMWTHRALEGIGLPVLPALLRLLERREGKLTWDLARALGATRSRAALPILLAALHAEDSSTREDAAVGLGFLGAPDTASVLIGALQDPEPAVRSEVAAALGRLGAVIAEDALLAASTDPDPEVRENSIAALARLGTTRSLERVVEALDDSEVRVRVAATHGVASRHVRFAVLRLLDRLDKADPGIGTGTEIDAVLDALARLADPAAETTLIAFLGEPHARWRSDAREQSYGDKAALALEAIGTRTARSAAITWRSQSP